jgi:hypothetical protein
MLILVFLSSPDMDDSADDHKDDEDCDDIDDDNVAD